MFTAIQESVCGADIAVSWTPPASLQRTVYLQLKVLYADYQEYVDTITQATSKSKPGPKDATKTPKTSKKFFDAAYPTKAAQGTGEYQIVLMDGVISVSWSTFPKSAALSTSHSTHHSPPNHSCYRENPKGGLASFSSIVPM